MLPVPHLATDQRPARYYATWPLCIILLQPDVGSSVLHQSQNYSPMQLLISFFSFTHYYEKSFSVMIASITLHKTKTHPHHYYLASY